MFHIGDTVVYPCQGIGKVMDIVEKEVDGDIKSYFEIELINGSMRLLVPYSRVEAAGIRLVSDEDTIDQNLGSIDVLVAEYEEFDKFNDKQKMSINTQKVKSGALPDYLYVVYNLSKANETKKLNLLKSQMLTATKNIIVEEISQSKGLSKEDSIQLLEDSLSIC